MVIPQTPSNIFTTQANRQVYIQWDIAVSATSYSIQRSLDGVTYATIATPAINNYTDTTVSIGTLYYYQVAAVNINGSSAYSTPQQIIPTPTGEMSLGQIRLAAQQRSDLVNSTFITTPEWNSYINQAMYALYDILITTYEDYFLAPPAKFISAQNQFMYPLPDGALTFQNFQSSGTFVAPPFYKLMGVDLAINSANNANVTVSKFNFRDRNQFVYPNTAATIYGVFNLRYRVLGTQIELIPTPSAGQPITLWYIPRLPELLKDTDITTIGFSGWLEYVIVRAAILAMSKEQSDTSSLVMQLADLQKRIEESAMNRDAGQPDTITNVRGNGQWDPFNGGGWSGSIGGF